MIPELVTVAALVLAGVAAGAMVVTLALVVGIVLGVRIRMGQPVLPSMSDFRRFVENFTSGREAAAKAAGEKKEDPAKADPKAPRRL